MKEYGDKIPADKKGAIEAALTQLKDAHKSRDLASIETAMTALNSAWEVASKDLYNASQEPGQAPQGENTGNASNNADGVTDVDYEEVKEK